MQCQRVLEEQNYFTPLTHYFLIFTAKLAIRVGFAPCETTARGDSLEKERSASNQQLIDFISQRNDTCVSIIITFIITKTFVTVNIGCIPTCIVFLTKL